MLNAFFTVFLRKRHQKNHILHKYFSHVHHASCVSEHFFVVDCCLLSTTNICTAASDISLKQEGEHGAKKRIYTMFHV